jgi:predicted amidophosphoribosyltransferase
VAYGSYDGGLRELIHLLKYQQLRPAAAALGRMLAEAIAGLDYCRTGSRISVVPVRLQARKLRQRGFNQSELVAREALKIAGRHGRLALQSQVLERHGIAKASLKPGSAGTNGAKISAGNSSW